MRMTGIFIGSTTPRAGKSLLTFSLGVLLQRAGYNVGYMKPLGRVLQKVEELPGDADALVVQEILGQSVPANILTPVILPGNLHALALYGDAASDAETLGAIANSYEIVSRDKDLMLVCGSGSFPATGHFCGADGLSVTKRLGLKTLFIERFDGRINYDALLHMKRILKNDMLGVILNDVPAHELRDAEKLLVPYLSSKGVRVHGIIPREPSLTAIRVADLAHSLSGCIMAGNAGAARMIDGFLIGTMQVDNFMVYLRQNAGKAVIVGGDRADLQFAALQSDSPCLILTSNIPPTELVRNKAEEMDIPLITVREDAYTVARIMAHIFRTKKLRDLNQIRLGISLVENSVSMKSLIRCMKGRSKA
jgi:BioD-like phosphotransacetylase family protein